MGRDTIPHKAKLTALLLNPLIRWSVAPPLSHTSKHLIAPYFSMLDVLSTRCVPTIGKYGLPGNPPAICSQKFNDGDNVLYFRQLAV